MPYTREKLQADIQELRQGGTKALRLIHDEFDVLHKLCTDALDFVRSKDFQHKMNSTSDFPKTPKVTRNNNNDINHMSLETSLPKLHARKLLMMEAEDEGFLESSLASTGSSFNDGFGDVVDHSHETKRIPTRSSQRIKALSDSLGNLDASTSSSKASDSSFIDPVKKSNLRKPTRSSQRSNTSSASLERSLHEKSASSTNSEYSSSDAGPTGNLKKSKPQQIKSSQQTSTKHGAGPASKKLARGAPVSSRPAPLSKKILQGAPTTSGSQPAPKKVLKGTPTTSGPQLPPKKLVKGTPTMSGLQPAPKKVLKGTPTTSGPQLPPKRLVKGTPTMSGSQAAPKKLLKGTPTMSESVLPSKKPLIGTPTLPRLGHPSRLGFTKIAPTTSKPAPHQNMELSHGVQGGPVSRHDYVQLVAEKGFSHLGKSKTNGKREDFSQSSLIKPIPMVKDSRETFVITPSGNNDTFVVSSALGDEVKHDEAKAPRQTFVISSSDEANATFVVNSSDIILNSEKKVLKGLKNLASYEDPEDGKSDVAHCLNTTFPVAKDPNATFEIASYDVTLDPEERSPLPSKNKDDYGLDDVRSDDSSDDESNPKKVVPQWAQAANRKLDLQMQYEVTSSQMFAFFESVETTPDLTKLFTDKIDRRMLIRRSSAVWLPPEIK